MITSNKDKPIIIEKVNYEFDNFGRLIKIDKYDNFGNLFSNKKYKYILDKKSNKIIKIRRH